MQRVEPGIQISNLPITKRPTLPPVTTAPVTPSDVESGPAVSLRLNALLQHFSDRQVMSSTHQAVR